MTLTEFLLARIAEDETATSELLRRSQEHELSCSDPRLLGTKIPGWYDWPKVQATAARVLAECEAKRRIAAHHFAEGHCVYDDESPACTTCGDYTIKWPCLTLRYLAFPYADHPDYREEWRP